jgi:hypothetical protein
MRQGAAWTASLESTRQPPLLPCRQAHTDSPTLDSDCRPPLTAPAPAKRSPRHPLCSRNRSNAPVRRPLAGDAAPAPTSTARGSFRSPYRRRYRNAEACSTTSPPQSFTSRNAASRRHLRHIAKRVDNMRISCGPPPKAESPGLEPLSQISRTHARPPARLLHSCVIERPLARYGLSSDDPGRQELPATRPRSSERT